MSETNAMMGMNSAGSLEKETEMLVSEVESPEISITTPLFSIFCC